jgi:hypothetical protein
VKRLSMLNELELIKLKDKDGLTSEVSNSNSLESSDHVRFSLQGLGLLTP